MSEPRPHYLSLLNIMENRALPKIPSGRLPLLKPPDSRDQKLLIFEKVFGGACGKVVVTIGYSHYPINSLVALGDKRGGGAREQRWRIPVLSLDQSDKSLTTSGGSPDLNTFALMT